VSNAAHYWSGEIHRFEDLWLSNPRPATGSQSPGQEGSDPNGYEFFPLLCFWE